MADINVFRLNMSAKESPALLISESEERYHKFIKDTAKRIASDVNVRLVLLAGPSGSGKTTTANLLSDELIARGLESLVISLDDFYRNAADPEYPKLADGERDYESPYALDLPEVERTLSAIAMGCEFSLPHYDFKVAKRTSVTSHAPITHGCVIIEGLHALNPLIFSKLPIDRMLKIFISVSTNICDDTGVRILSGRKLRFVRRMVRDSIYRAAEAERTLEMWSNVLVGEDKFLYPFRNNADIGFDTFHPFEFGVMANFVLELISDELASSNTYAGEVKRAAKTAYPIPESLVPKNSLIREFIPGGMYEHKY